MTAFSILVKLSDNKPLKNIAKADITTHLTIQIADVNCSHMLNYILCEIRFIHFLFGDKKISYFTINITMRNTIY